MATEINSKYFQDNEMELKESQVRVVTFYLEYNSTFKAANAIEKLLGAGHTIDQIREMQGLDPIGDEHTTRRYLTRNIGGIEQADLKGGENTERGTIKEDAEN